jgi:glycosyltransferase involved in cell wall biosynthesis
MNLYFEASILQQPVVKGCQVYTYNMLRQMADMAPEHTFHLHFAMQGWHPNIDDLLSRRNVRGHRWHGPFGRHVAPPLEIARTRSRVFLMMNGTSGRQRVPVPCASGAVFHDLRLIRCRDIYGAAVCDKFTRLANTWIRAHDCIVTGAETIKAEIVETFGLPPDRIVVASESTDHHPPDAPSKRPSALPDGATYFVMVNPGEVRKNWQDVLDGFALYLRERPEDTATLMVLVGGLNDQAGMVRERLAADPLLEKRILNLQYVSDDELRYVYKNACLSIYPSKYEGFGIPVLESMGQGTPVIVSDIPIFREVAGDAGVFVPLGAPDRVAEAMKRLRTDPAHRAMHSARGKEQAARFSWRKSAGVLLDTLVRLGRGEAPGAAG